MKKHLLKYIIDACLFVNMAAIALLGLLLGFVIPRGGGPTHGSFLGLGRHDWGDIHLYLSIVLLCFLAAHIWQNWSWVKGATQRYFGTAWRRALWSLCAASAGLLIIMWIGFLL